MTNWFKSPHQNQRDSCGIPIIQASDERELFRQMGLWHARDRRGQMIFMRIIGQGKISEVLDSSDESLEADIFFRQMNWHTASDDQVKALTPEHGKLPRLFAARFEETKESRGGLCVQRTSQKTTQTATGAASGVAFLVQVVRNRRTRIPCA